MINGSCSGLFTYEPDVPRTSAKLVTVDITYDAVVEAAANPRHLAFAVRMRNARDGAPPELPGTERQPSLSAKAQRACQGWWRPGFGMISVLGSSADHHLPGCHNDADHQRAASREQSRPLRSDVRRRGSWIDQSLAQVRIDKNWSIPDDQESCSVPDDWQDGFPTWVEKDWVMPKVDAAGGHQARSRNCTTGDQLKASICQTPQGQFLVIKPDNVPTVYSMGWMPRPRATRSELVSSRRTLVSTYRPGNAILAAGTVDLGRQFPL